MNRQIAGVTILATLLSISARAEPATVMEVPVFTSDGRVGVARLSGDALGNGQVPVGSAGEPVSYRVTELLVFPSPQIVRRRDGRRGMLDLDSGIEAELLARELEILVFLLTGQVPSPAATGAGAPGGSSPGSSASETQPFTPARALSSRRRGGEGDRKVARRPRHGKRKRRSGGGDRSGEPKRTFRVKATAEGLIGHQTATGEIIKKWQEGVALPDRSALNRHVHVTLLANDRATSARVFDVGPWSTNDPYWRTGTRPRAESRPGNHAGIDLSDAVWYNLLNLHSFDIRLIESKSGMVRWGFVN